MSKKSLYTNRRAAYQNMNVEEILESMGNTKLRKNAARGGIAAIAELKRRESVSYPPPTPEFDIGV